MYKKFVASYIEVRDEYDIRHWQQLTFFSVFLIGYAVGLLTLATGMPFLLSLASPVPLIAITALVAFLGVGLFARRIRYTVKLYVLNVGVYLIAATALALWGPTGDGRLFFGVLVVLAAAFTPFWSAIACALVVFVTDLSIGYLNHLSLLSWEEYNAQSMVSWLRISLNQLVLNAVVIIMLHVLLTGVRRWFERYTRSRVAIVAGLAKLAEYRDNDTGDHLERIRRYTVAVAERLSRLDRYRDHIGAGYLRDVAVSAMLHDIGKVGIPDAVLLKPGRLDAAEYDVIKKHPEYGAEVITRIAQEIGDAEFLSMAKNIACYHHERWDGAGYPHGIGGDEIPLSARIVAIVDVYDALVSERAYKQALPHEEAIAIIRAGRGTQFDPDIVDTFLELFASGPAE